RDAEPEQRPGRAKLRTGDAKPHEHLRRPTPRDSHGKPNSQGRSLLPGAVPDHHADAKLKDHEHAARTNAPAQASRAGRVRRSPDGFLTIGPLPGKTARGRRVFTVAGTLPPQP